MNSSLKITMPVHRSFSEARNKRVYDPVITNPTFTQDYNAYSYVRNNPLVYVDPSGYISQAMWDRAIAILNDDNIKFGGSVSDEGDSIFKSQDEAFDAASEALDISNGWWGTEAKTKEGSEYRFNSAMGYIKSVNRKRITGFNINFSLGSRIHINRWSRNTKFHFDPSFSLFSYKNVWKEVWVGPVDPDPASNGGGPLYISNINVNETTQRLTLEWTGEGAADMPTGPYVISTGRLKYKSKTEDRTPNGVYTVTWKYYTGGTNSKGQVSQYPNALPSHSGCHWAVNINGGIFFHTYEYSDADWTAPCSLGCVRIQDVNAAQLIWENVRYNSTTVNIYGHWPGF